MRPITEMPLDERELKLALIGAPSGGEPSAAWLRRYPQAARALTDLATALAAARRGPAPTPAEVRRAAAWLRLALWQAQAPTRPQ